MNNWRFRKKRADEVSSDSLASGYFSNDELTSDAIALVRESIQNSIDARISEDLPARVVFSFHRRSDPTGSNDFFGSLEPHTLAVLGTDKGRVLDSARHLVIEDFNTKGLRGDTATSESMRAEDTYVWFMWKEGSSSKSQGTKGKKGVGKAVFPKVSGLRSFFVYSVRDSDYSPCGKRNLFIGKAKLKYHTLSHGSTYAPEGWFADWLSRDDGDIPTPFTSEVAEEFARYWGVKRELSQPGLSVVIPQLADEVTPEAVRSSVIRQYFLAIKLGEVECEIVMEDGTSELLTSETFNAAFQSTAPVKKGVPRDLEWDHVSKAVELVDKHLEGIKVQKLEVDDDSSGIKNYRFSRHFLRPLSERLDTESFASIEVELAVPVEHSKKSTPANFRILISKCAGGSYPIIYSREGLLVPGHQSINVNGHVVIVHIPPGPLGDFLGNSEGPSHETWSNTEEVFKEKYSSNRSRAERVISVVRQLPKRIDEELNRISSQRGDADYFSKYFKLPLPQATPAVEPKKKDPDAVEVNVVSKTSRLSIQRTRDVVSVLPGGKDWQQGTQFKLEFAFGTATGNPFKQWSPFDFDLTDPSFEIKVTGLNILERRQSDLILETSSTQNWKLEIAGFDIYRDVEVRDTQLETSEEVEYAD